MIQIHTDGSCLNNPGPGGWAYIMLQDNKIIAADCAYAAHTTNNQMELGAVLAALEATDARQIELFSDSSYVCRTINEWLPGWQKVDFKGKKNPDLWRKYCVLAQKRSIKATWVKGHAGDFYNELCDELARSCAEGKLAQAKDKCAKLCNNSSSACSRERLHAASASSQLDDLHGLSTPFGDGRSAKSSHNSFAAGDSAMVQKADSRISFEKRAKFFKLEERLNHKFQSDELLFRAFRHKSAGKLNNERLEFLGDAVMDLVLAKMLFSDEAKYNEGDLSKIRAALVNEKSFAKMAVFLELGELLELSAAEEKGGGRNKPSLLSDAFEAIMGLIYLEAGFEKAFEIGKKVVSENFPHISADLIKDYKTKLQELTQARWGVIPEYRVLGSSGPDHAKQFEIGLFLSGEIRSRAIGKSKKEAEQKCAEALFNELY